MRAYFDYAATTPLDPKVLKEMMPFLKKEYGNPSSLHKFGQKAFQAIEKAREEVSKFLNCHPEEIYFTSSATESNNLAIQGLIRTLKRKMKSCHIITSQIEHHSVLDVCQYLEKEQGVEVSFVSPNKEGIVEVKDVEKEIKPNTVLVSIMYANNEIGTIQPISKIGELIEKVNSTRSSKIYFHTDAVQAINYLDCDVKKLKVDMLTMSAHKIYGPKGVGCLYVKEGTPLTPLFFGGGQERKLRSGTENVAGIVGFGKAIEELRNPKIKIQNIKIRQMRDKLIKKIIQVVPHCKLNGSLKERLPNNINFTFKGVEGEAIVMALDKKGIAVSTGSACSSKGLEPSHVLLAIGLSPEDAHSSVRITLGRFTLQEEVNYLLKTLPKIIKKLREISGFKER